MIVTGPPLLICSWNKGITEYINYFPIAPSNVQYGFDIQGDSTGRKTIEERVLIGDPSIKLGGYGLKISSDETEDQTENREFTLVDIPAWSQGQQWIYRGEY